MCRCRYDYVDEMHAYDLPGFNRLINHGVKAEYVRGIYPTFSYPTWTTLTTGLYAESHGIIGNYFYDPNDGVNGDVFSLFDAGSTGKKKVIIYIYI